MRFYHPNSRRTRANGGGARPNSDRKPRGDDRLRARLTWRVAAVRGRGSACEDGGVPPIPAGLAPKTRARTWREHEILAAKDDPYPAL
jgi:hypothetical protein